MSIYPYTVQCEQPENNINRILDAVPLVTTRSDKKRFSGVRNAEGLRHRLEFCKEDIDVPERWREERAGREATGTEKVNRPII